MSLMKKVYRSTENKVFFGVIGGIGEYLEVDPVILRLLWVLITFLTGLGAGLVVYLIATLIIPRKPKQ